MTIITVHSYLEKESFYMITLSALNQYLKQHTPEETQRLNGVKKDYSQFPVARGKFDTPCYRFDTNLEDLRSLFFQRKFFRAITTSLL